MFIEKQSVWYGLGNNSAERVRVAGVYKNSTGQKWVRVALLRSPGGQQDMTADEFTSRYCPVQVLRQEVGA